MEEKGWERMVVKPAVCRRPFTTRLFDIGQGGSPGAYRAPAAGARSHGAALSPSPELR